MSDQTPTFTFEDGQVYAILGNKVIASGPEENLEKVQSDAVAYLDGLNTEKQSKVAADKRRRATHIITPNGVKGEILGQTPSLWGDEVTVRFANNQVQRFSTHGEEGYEYVTETQKTASSSDPVEKLDNRLSAEYDVDKDSLITRTHELRDIAKEARKIATYSQAPLDVQQRVSNIHTAAENELTEVRQAIAAIDQRDDDENPFIPFESKVAVQADLGATAKNASWLDITTEEMIREASEQDMDQLLEEGPALFAADLDDSVIAHTGSVLDMARTHITSKTAGFEGSEIEDFRDSFVAKTEVARRHELAARKAATKQKVAAAEEEATDFPDEALFS